MFVIKHYMPKWEKSVASEGAGDTTSTATSNNDEGGSNEARKGGAVKGDANTCIKQKACYYEFCEKVQQARSSVYKDNFF